MKLTYRKKRIVNQFDVNKVTDQEQARKNMKVNNPTNQAVFEMMHQMEEDKKMVVLICKKEIQDM